MPDTLTLSIAQTTAEKEAVYRFRYDVYVREMGKVRMAQVDHGRGWLREDSDELATIFVARAGDDVIGTLRSLSGARHIPDAFRALPHFSQFAALPPEALSFSGRLMVAPGQRGSTALTALVGAAYEYGLNEGVYFDFCVCSPGLVDLYEHLGFRRFTGNLVDPVVGYQVPLVLAARDGRILRAVQSPLSRLWRRHPASEAPPPAAIAAVQDWLHQGSSMTSTFIREWVADEGAFWGFLTEKMRTAVSGTASILEDLDEEEQKKLLRGGTILDFVAGDQVITAGTVGTEVFVVLQGLLEVHLPQQPQPVAVLDCGQIFGEIAFIADTTRTADVVALTEGRLLVLGKATLNRLMKTAPELAAKLMFNLSRVLCERLVTSNRRSLEKQ